MSVHVIDIGRTFPQDICEEKTVAQTCQKCGAPLRNNKCEYCGTEYESSRTKEADHEKRNRGFDRKDNGQINQC